jgi:hypothetical protein
VTLRIAERLEAGTTEIAEIARAAECDADSLQRVIRHLIGKGLFVEPAPGRFALNHAARALTDPGVRIGLDLNGIGGRMAHAWGTMLKAVQTGKPAYHEVFGRPFWADLNANPEIAADFDALLGPVGHGTPDPDILLDDDWEAVKSVVDVGGGVGALLTEILRVHPEITGTLVDLPRPVATAFANFEAAGVSERAKTSAQSFFDPLPSGADLYVLKSILNDWPDQEALMILQRCADAMHPEGRIVVNGGVSGGEKSGGVTIEMVLLGGKDRTVPEFSELVRGAGLRVDKHGLSPSGRFLVELRKIASP